MSAVCLACEHTRHRNNQGPCQTPGCSCTTFERATPTPPGTDHMAPAEAASHLRHTPPYCPECQQPIQPGDTTIIAHSTSYRVHEECGDDSDRAGINPLEAASQRLANLEHTLEHTLRAYDAGEFIAPWEWAATVRSALDRPGTPQPTPPAQAAQQ